MSDWDLWDWACLQGSEREVHFSDAEPFAYGACWGAGWAFAIIGMAQAIWDREHARERAHASPEQLRAHMVDLFPGDPLNSARR